MIEKKISFMIVLCISCKANVTLNRGWYSPYKELPFMLISSALSLGEPLSPYSDIMTVMRSLMVMIVWVG